ncbi:Clp protease N-terminal domain-containing protein, partial [Cellulomonas massiliensis]|uniref:Clp protease N-terminal domain-containing protein n=1 Tax=Cellulomonas massiliensis TaxID=1465811 RepID=UPI00035DDFC5
MFERFTTDARRAVTLAQGAAAALDADAIGPEHLLLALAHDEASVAGRALASVGVDHAALEDRVRAARRPDGPDPQ